MKLMKGSFSSVLLAEMKKTLAEKKQILLFQNRRGYAPSLYCGMCGWIPECSNCAVKLTYHKFSDSLKCHYCGFTRKVLVNCMACGNSAMRIQGFGTEKVEDELKLLLPEARIARMDADTVRGKEAHNKIIKAVEDREIDILVGTQMITKGLDFDHIKLVGVLSANSLMSFPDFRVVERAFQLLTQVGGRSGRKNEQGKVLIQTLNTKFPVLEFTTGTSEILQLNPVSSKADMITAASVTFPKISI
jgi:primosomal protein N' (replication factor Y)